MLRTAIRRFKGLSSEEQEELFDAVKLRKRKQLQQEGCATCGRDNHTDSSPCSATHHVSSGAQLSPPQQQQGGPAMLNLAFVLCHPTGGWGGGLINSLLSFTRDDWNQTKTVTLQAPNLAPNLSITVALQEVNAGQ